MLTNFKISKTLKTQMACLSYLFIGKFGAALSFAEAVVFFAGTIRHVCAMRASLKMLGIDASRRVAEMQDFQAFGDWKMVDFKRYTMRQHSSLVKSGNAVAFVGKSSTPEPTVFGLFYFCPEFLFKWLTVLRRTFSTAKVFATTSDLVGFARVFLSAFAANKSNLLDSSAYSTFLRAQALTVSQGAKLAAANAANPCYFRTSHFDFISNMKLIWLGLNHCPNNDLSRFYYSAISGFRRFSYGERYQKD